MIRKTTKCYIYTRVSTAIQVDGYSLDAQREKLKKYAEFQKYEIVGEYCDGGFSGKNTKDRPEFQRMMKDIQDNKDGVSFVLVFKLSRFGRNAADVLGALQLMLAFDELYAELEDIEKRDVLRAIVERVDLYPEKRSDGCWVRNIVFNFPVPVGEVELKELPLENATTLESVVLLTKVHN